MQLAPPLLAALMVSGCGRLGFDLTAGSGGGDDDDGDAAGDGSPFGSVPDVPTIPCTGTSFTFVTDTVDMGSPSLAWSGAELGLAWASSDGTAHFRTATLDGQLGPILDLGTGGAGPRVAWDGAAWRIVWSGPDKATGNPDAEILRSTDGGPFEVMTMNTVDDGGVRQAVLGGGAMAYAWGASTSKSATAFAADGTKLFPDVTLSTSASSPWPHALLWTGSELLSIHKSDDETQLVMNRIAPSGSFVGGPIVLDTGAIGIGLGATVVGDRIFVVWSESAVARGRYFAFDGTPLTPVGAAPAASTFADVQSAVAGATFERVIWSGLAPIGTYVMSVARDGTASAPMFIAGPLAPAGAYMSSGLALASDAGMSIQLDVICD
jgi:hypothetical protein